MKAVPYGVRKGKKIAGDQWVKKINGEQNNFGSAPNKRDRDAPDAALANYQLSQQDSKLQGLAQKWFREQSYPDQPLGQHERIPELLDMLDLEGSTVTLDVMGSQLDIAQKLLEKKADYALALKDNHKTLHTQTVLLMAEADDQDTTLKHATHRTVERGHGRDETRLQEKRSIATRRE